MQTGAVNEATMTDIVRILSVLLPPDNRIPSYKVLKSTIATLDDITFERHPLCSSCEKYMFKPKVDGKIVDADEDCTLCGATRDLEAERMILYFPLEPQLKRLVTNPELKDYFKKNHLQPEATMDDTMYSIKDSPFWKRWVLDSGFADEDGGIVLGTSGDGAPPWKKRGRLKYSIWFCASEVLNLPFDEMSNPDNRYYLNKRTYM